MAQKQYVIWSLEHDAWWAPDWCGYTRSLQEAGRYSEEESAKILRRANQFAVVEAAIGVTINECRIPVEVVGLSGADTAQVYVPSIPAEGDRRYTQAELNEAISLAVERTIQNVREGRVEPF